MAAHGKVNDSGPVIHQAGCDAPDTCPINFSDQTGREVLRVKSCDDD